MRYMLACKASNFLNNDCRYVSRLLFREQFILSWPFHGMDLLVDSSPAVCVRLSQGCQLAHTPNVCYAT